MVSVKIIGKIAARVCVVTAVVFTTGGRGRRNAYKGVALEEGGSESLSLSEGGGDDYCCIIN